MKYAVELEGHNDGLPYVVTTSTNKFWIEEQLEKARSENPRVRHRLIAILDDFSFTKNSP